MKNKFLYALVTAAVGASCLFAACSNDDKGGEDNTPPTHEHTYSTAWSMDEAYHWHAATCEHSSEVSGKAAHTFNGNTCVTCSYTKPFSITLSDFIAKHKNKAVSFVSLYIRPEAIGTNEVLAERWSISANENDELTSVSFALTFKDDETNRTVQIVNVTLENPIDLDDIVSGKASMSGNSAKTSRTTVFSFDAKENSQKQNLASALYAAHGDTSDLMLFTEVEASRGTRKAYDILVDSGSEYKVKTLEVLRDDGSDETIIKNLKDNKTAGLKTKNTYTLNGTNIYSSAYTLENFGGSEIDPEKPTPTPGDVTNAEIVEALETNCKDGLLNKCLAGLEIDKNNVSNENWYVTKDSDGNITSAQYSFNYQRSTSSAYYTVGTVNFSNPISSEDLISGNIENATYTRFYRFNYDTTIQETRADLTNAICNTILGSNDNATRFIVDNGPLTNEHQFKVVEITESKVEEVTIFIKNASNDAGYIQNLQNPENYSIEAHETYTLSGERLIIE